MTDSQNPKPSRSVLQGCLVLCGHLFAWTWLVLGIAIWMALPPAPLATLAPGSPLFKIHSDDKSVIAFAPSKTGGPWRATKHELQTGKASQQELPSSTFSSPAFCEISPDGRLVAYGEIAYGGETSIHVFDLASGKLVRDFPTSEINTWSRPIAFSGDAALLAVQTKGANSQVTVEIWKPGSNEMVASLPGLRAPLAMSASGKWLAACDADHRVCLINAATGETIHQFSSHTSPVSLLEFSDDAQLVSVANRYAASMDDARPSEVWLHDLDQRKTVRQWNLPQASLSRIWFDHSGQFLCGQDAMLGAGIVWNISSSSRSSPEITLEPPVISRDGERKAVMAGKLHSLVFFAVWEDPYIQIIDRNQKTGAELKSIWPKEAVLRPLEFSPDGKTLAVQTTYRSLLKSSLPTSLVTKLGLNTSNIELWFVDVATGRLQFRLPGSATQATAGPQLYLTDGHLITADQNANLYIWNPHPHPSIGLSLLIVIVATLPMLLLYRKRIVRAM